MGETRLRLLTALVALPCVIACICLLPQLAFSAFVAIVLALAMREGSRLVGWREGMREWLIPVTVLVSVVAFEQLRNSTFGDLVVGLWIGTGLILVAVGVFTVLTYSRSSSFLRTREGTLAFLFLLCVCAGVMANAIRAQVPYGLTLVALLVVVWATDSGAYLTGKVLGRRKLIPSVSAGKTWEGTLGGAGAGLVAAVVCHLTLGWFGSVFQALLAALPLIVAAVFGDLMISAIKRAWGTKDSGSFFPGHGGFLDRLDSVLAAAPVAAALHIAA